MFRKMTAVIAALAVPIMMTACGGEGDPGQAEPPGARAAPAAEARAETNARTGGREEVPAPTRPQRLNLTPTEEPSATGEAAKTAPGGKQRENPQIGRAPAATETASPERAPTYAEQAAATRAASAEAATPRRRAQKTLSGDTSPEGLIPEDPETNDEVLLQDIYALMDLDQFALNPNQAIPLPDKENMSYSTLGGEWFSEPLREDHPPSLFDYEEVRDHPYLHLFPGLKGHVEAFQNMEAEGRGLSFQEYPPHNQREFPYHATNNPDSNNFIGNWNRPGKRFLPMGGITHFIYHPWFEPVEYGELNEGTTRTARRAELDKYQTTKEGDTYRFLAMPHWFGNNSTRGVIADAVARALEQARRPGVEEHPVPALNIRHNYLNLEKVAYGGNKNLAGHLRTPIETIYGDLDVGIYHTAHTTPFVQWEFLHPSLPIIRVTSFVAATLPLANPGEEPRATGLAVSFVISFQNRWDLLRGPQPLADTVQRQDGDKRGAVPPVLAHQRLHAAPPHRPGDRPGVQARERGTRGHPARRLCGATEGLPLGGPGAHPEGRAGPGNPPHGRRQVQHNRGEDPPRRPPGELPEPGVAAAGARHDQPRHGAGHQDLEGRRTGLVRLVTARRPGGGAGREMD